MTEIQVPGVGVGVDEESVGVSVFGIGVRAPHGDDEGEELEEENPDEV
jgi:hypothetical protein